MMASSTGLICSECQKKGKTSAAESWCPECFKSLCTICKKQHDGLNASINHKTIPADVYKSMPTFVLNLNLHCDKHKKKYENYCPDHQLLLCKKCVETAHIKCKELISLDQVTKNTNSSVAFDNMRKSIDVIQLKFEKIRQNRSDNLTSVRKQIKAIHKDISNFRSRLNETLDNMEKELINEMENVEKKTASHLTILFKDLQEHENKIEEMKIGIEGLKKYGTDFQTFLAGNQIEAQMHQEGEYIQSLLNKKVLENTIIKYVTDSNFQTIISENVKFGKISVETTPSDILVLRENVRGIQQPVRSHFSQIPIAQRFRVKSTKQIDCNITAVCVLPNMDMVFIGRNNMTNEEKYENSCMEFKFCLIVYNSEGILKYSFQLENVFDVTDITSIDDRTVAIMDSKVGSKIKLIDILERKYMKILDTKYYSISLSRSNDVLYYTSYQYGIHKIDLHNYSVSPFIKLNCCIGVYYVATFEDKICCSDCVSGNVVLYNSASDVLWKYKDDTLGSPMKATFDKKGNIYIVGSSTYNVVLISRDGKQSRQVLSKEDGIMNTMSIEFDFRRNRLIVVSLLGDVVIYNCS